VATASENRLNMAAEVAAGEAPYGFNFITIARVRHQFKVNAEHAGIAIPERLTVADDEPGYKEWRKKIRDYQDAAGARMAKDLVKA
jgi:hypothetical protein